MSSTTYRVFENTASAMQMNQISVFENGSLMLQLMMLFGSGAQGIGRIESKLCPTMHADSEELCKAVSWQRLGAPVPRCIQIGSLAGGAAEYFNP